MRTSIALGLVAAVLACATGCGPEGCLDRDEDGFGLRCAMGLDCDDTNPERTLDCALVPAPDCVAVPSAPGCPCLAEETATCYRGPAETRGVGVCRAGRARCVNGHFGLCVGEVVPELFEACDLEDGDCDGRVDERVTSPCGVCDASCTGGVWGAAEAPFVAEAPLALTSEGALTLGRRPVTSASVWVTNTADGTVSRIDASDALERARHFSAPIDGVAPEPSRVAVDWNGDAWVLNRSFGGQGSVTKIAGEPARCVDRDGDGAITSSRSSSPVPFERDECVLLHVPLGAPAALGEDGSVPRAIAIDGDRGLDGASGGNPLIGLYGENMTIQLDGLTGEERARVPLGDVQPYLAAIDSRGNVWMGSQRGVLVRVDPSFEPPDATRIELPADCFETYSLAIDEADRLYLTGFACDSVLRFDPSRGELRTLYVPPSPRGAALWNGRLWVAHTGGLASEISLEPFALLRTIDLDAGDGGPRPRQTIGAAIDSIGHAWMVSETGGPGGNGIASRIDLERGLVDAYVEVGRAPHAQGDLTGWQRVAEREPEGRARHVFRGCEEGDATDWVAVHVRGELPEGARIDVAVRQAVSLEALAARSFEALGSLPEDGSRMPLDLPGGGLVEVEVTLRSSSRRTAPVLRLLGVEWGCGGPG